MSSSRRTRQRRQQRSLQRHQLRLEGLEKRYALDGSSLSISMNADYVAAGTTFPTDYGSASLANISEPISFFLPQQNLVSFASVTDATPGMVITSLDLNGGQLWYSVNSGNTWFEITSASQNSGTVLTDDGNTRLHYEPPANYSSQLTDVFTFEAYDFASSMVSGTSQVVASAGSSSQPVGSYIIDHTMYEGTLGDGGKIKLFSDGIRAAAIHDDGLEILDISNPASIQRIGITPSESPTIEGLFSDVHIAGSEASVFINPTTPSTNGAFVVDLTNQSVPQLLPYNANTFAWTVTSNSDGSMVILGSTGGPEGQSFSNLHFFDTTNRASPQLLSSLNLTIPAATFGTPPFEFTAESDLEVHGITISPDGNTLYVSCLSEMQHQFNVPLFFVVNISNVQQPQVIAQVSKVGFTSDLIFSPSHTLSLDGNTLYVAANEGTYNETGGGGFLAAYDVSNPTSPSQMWKRQFQYGGGFANEVVLNQSTDRIFVAYDGGVRSFAVNQFGVTDEALVSAAGMTNGVAVSADGKHAFVMEQDLLAVYAQNENFSVSVNIASAPNGPPTDLFLSYTAVGENSQGATVGQLSTTDSDPGDIFTYSLVLGSGSTDNSLFYIEGDYLRVGTNLDYESSDTARIRIRTTDAQGQYFEKAFVIGVQNYNEPPTDISLSSTTVPEKQSVGTVVGTLTSTDPDGSNFAGFAESFTYSLTIGEGDTDNSSFEIIEDELRTKESFDYGVKNSYSVRIRTEDNMGVPFEKQFLINVATNLNPSFDHISGWTHSGSTVIDFFPVTVSGITAGLGENQPLRITTSSNAEVVSYTSPESTAEIIIEIPGAEIYLPGDGGDTYTITVEDGGFDNNLDTASDNGTYSQSFTVTVPSMYEPDPPYDLYLSPASVNENEQDATVGGFYSSSTDPFFDSPWFSLISGLGDTNNGLFYTEGDLLKTNTSFNYETRQTASIRVRAENSIGYHDEVFEITIENVNEAPTDILLFNPIVVENWPVGSYVSSFSTVDPDVIAVPGVIGAPSGFTYELVQGTGDENNASFEITDGVLRTNEIFDYESKSSYSVRVRTTDSGGLSFEKQFSVTVLNAQNERPILDPSAHPQLQSVIEDAGDPVGQVGTLVSDLIDTVGPLNNFHDDDGDLPGIRIVGTSPQVEDIWFTIDGGAQWNKVNNISRANSLLLFADTQTRVYVTGVADYSGALSEAIEFHAWDRTGSHENGARIVYDPVMFSYDTPEHSRWDDIEISPDGKHAFVGTAGIDGSLQVFNIENPLHPVLVSTNNGGNDFSAMILSSDGQYLFHHDDLRLGIIDVSNPAEPSVIASVEHGEGWPTWCLSPDEKYLYKATFDSSVLVIDVQEVTEPVLAGSISLPFFPNILKASADGKYIYASQWNSSVLHVIDITDSVNPIYDYAVNANSNVLDIAVSPDGQYVYVTSEHAFEVFQPVPVPEPLPVPGPVPPNNSIGSPYDGVELVPVGELLLGPIRPNYWPYDFRNLSFSEDGKEVYLTDGGAILRIDITNPEIPQIINSWLPVGGSLRSIKPSNDSSFVLATDWDAGFRVVDVTQATPLYGASPGGVVDYSYRPSAAIVDIALNSDGTLMHLATNDGIHLLDDFNQLLSKIDSNEGVNVLEISSNDNFLCYADDTHLRVIDIRDRSNPFETSHIPLSDFSGSDVRIIEIKAMPMTAGVGGKFTVQSSILSSSSNGSRLSIVYVDGQGQAYLESEPSLYQPFLGFINDFTVSSSGYHVFVATDNEIRIWNTSGITLYGQDDPQSASYGITNYNAPPLFNKVTLSANENFLFVEDYYGVFHVLEILALGTWQEELRYVGTCRDGSGSPSTFISLSPDGKYLYAHDNAYGYDLTIYDVESPQSMKKINKLHFPNLNSQWEPPEDGIYQSISSSGALLANGTLYGVGREGLIYFPTEGWESRYSLSENTDTASIDVTPVNDPPTIGEIGNYVWYGNEFEDTIKTIYVDGVTAGSEEFSQPLRAYASTSNSELIVSPVVQFLPAVDIFPPEPYAVSLTYTIKAGHSGTSVISLLVEDGGLDNNLSTPGDNRSSSRESNVIVLLVISDSDNEPTPTGPKLARDNNFNIYVDGQPVTLNGEQIPSAINGFSFVRAESGSENALMLKPLGADAEDAPTHRLLTDETWRINGIFNSLQNASSPVLDLSGREVSGTLNIAAVAGAYVINGVNNPTLVVRRGQTYTFNLNTAGHPFYLQTAGGGYQSVNIYDSEFTGNSQTTGEHQWVVPQDAPEEIFYQCEFHPVMFGKIIVVD